MTPEQKEKRKAERLYKKRIEEYELHKQVEAILERKRRSSSGAIDSARRGFIKHNESFNPWNSGIKGDGQVFRGTPFIDEEY